MAGDKTYDQNGNLTAFPNLILVQNEPPLVPLWVPNAASESLEKKGRLLPFVSLILAPNSWSLHGFSQSNSSPKRASPGCTFAAKRRLRIPRKKKDVCCHWFRSSWPRTPGHATAIPNLILVQNEPPLVALSLPNAASESLEKKRRLLPLVSLILAPNTWSRHGFSQSNSTPKRASPGCTFAAKRRL